MTNNKSLFLSYICVLMIFQLYRDDSLSIVLNYKSCVHYELKALITWDIKTSCFTSAFHKISAVIMFYKKGLKYENQNFNGHFQGIILLCSSATGTLWSAESCPYLLILIINEFSWYCF